VATPRARNAPWQRKSRLTLISRLSSARPRFSARSFSAYVWISCGRNSCSPRYFRPAAFYFPRSFRYFGRHLPPGCETDARTDERASSLGRDRASQMTSRRSIPRYSSTQSSESISTWNPFAADGPRHPFIQSRDYYFNVIAIERSILKTLKLEIERRKCKSEDAEEGRGGGRGRGRIKIRGRVEEAVPFSLPRARFYRDARG